MIPVRVIGEVENGHHPGMKVEVWGDGSPNGGYHIVMWWPGSRGLGPNRAFDNWVATRDELELYFQESGWRVRWTGAADDSAHNFG